MTDIQRIIPQDEYVALIAADAPNQANPFATMNDLGAIAAINPNKLLGRYTASIGAPEEITIGNALVLSLLGTLDVSLASLDVTNALGFTPYDASNPSGYISGMTLTGEATGVGTNSVSVTLSNSAVIGKVLTGYLAAKGVVAATDTILQAIQKLDGNAKVANSNYVIKAIAYVLTTSDRTVEVTTAGATQTLHTAVGNTGDEKRIINASTGIVRVDTTSSQTIGNSAIANPIFVDLNPREWLDVVSNGTNWRMI